MSRERERLIELQKERDRIEIEIRKLTYNSKGISYSETLRSLLEELIESKFNCKNRSEKYKVYTKIRGSISKLVGVNTNTYTRSEYIKALSIVQDKYDFIVPEEYRV